MNVPITIAITAAADSPISEQNFNEHNYIKMFNGILDCNVTIVPLLLNTSPQKCQSYVPWYDGPDLASALSTITLNGNKTSNRIFVVTQKYISNARCIGVLRQGSLKVGELHPSLYLYKSYSSLYSCDQQTTTRKEMSHVIAFKCEDVVFVCKAELNSNLSVLASIC
jgi:translation elongation factor EF-1alpha